MSNAATNFFHKVKTDLSNAFDAIFGKDAASKLLAAEEAVLKTDIGAFALEVVQDLATTDITSQAAWEIAGVKIAAQAVILGVKLGKSQINLLIELVVAANKAKQPVPVAAPVIASVPSNSVPAQV